MGVLGDNRSVECQECHAGFLENRGDPVTTDNSFFNETTEQSEIKTSIVSKYFWAWAKVIIATIKKGKTGGKIAYIDLFAGPGRYKDGTKSTPLLVLEKAIQDEDMRNMLVTIFNDKDTNNSSSLQTAIKALPGIETMKIAPVVESREIGTEIVKMFEEKRLVPTLFFVDPWGYKGLSLQLVNSVLKDWGCDCIFFFNYNRINMGLTNTAVESHMNALFGKERADTLRVKLEPLSPEERELTVIEELCQALKEYGGQFVLPFRFKNSGGVRTSHHLIFVSKHFKGYEIMKGIMAAESSKMEQGVPSFEYSPADAHRQPMLFELVRPLDDLSGMLKTDFMGQKLTMQEIYERHNVGRRYIKCNYKDVLKIMEEKGEIIANPKAADRPRRKGEATFADNVLVAFPKTGGS
jgi:three-Cys-motif partner protein